MDIDAVDGETLAGNPSATGVVAVGRMLMALRGDARPARVMGPALWHRALGDGDRSGFRSDDFANEVHGDHLHIGF